MVKQNKNKKTKEYFLFGLFAIVIILGVGFKFGLLDLSTILTSSDFTMTNAEVDGGYIRLSNEPTDIYFSDVSWLSNKEVLLTYAPDNGVPDSAVLTSYGAPYKFCSAYGYQYDSLVEGGSTTNRYRYWNDVWSYGDSSLTSVSSITCIDNDNYYYTSGNLEQTTPTTTTEKYNYFVVEYTSSLNGGIIEPYLIVGEEKYYFTNNALSVSDIMSDTQLKLGFDLLTSDNELTPTIENSITLLGSYVEDSPSSSSSDDSSSTLQTLAILSAKTKTEFTNNLQDFGYWKNTVLNFLGSPLAWVGMVLIILLVLGSSSKKKKGGKR